MAKAKYTKGSDGYFKTNVWDGSYVNGRKHYIPVRSKKSSADLEKKVRELKNTVEQRDFVRKTDIMFIDYAKTWKDVYKSSRENNTKIMYKNIIEKHFSALEDVKLADIERIHLQMLLNNASGKLRTQQQILMTFKQIINSAVIDQLFPSNVANSIFDSIDSGKACSDQRGTAGSIQDRSGGSGQDFLVPIVRMRSSAWRSSCTYHL